VPVGSDDNAMKQLDPKLAEVIMGAVADYVGGSPYTAVTFDIMRMDEEAPSMEPVFMLLMSQKDWKWLSILMRIIHNKEGIDVTDRVKRAILSTLEEAKKEHDV